MLIHWCTVHYSNECCNSLVHYVFEKYLTVCSHLQSYNMFAFFCSAGNLWCQRTRHNIWRSCPLCVLVRCAHSGFFIHSYTCTLARNFNYIFKRKFKEKKNNAIIQDTPKSMLYEINLGMDLLVSVWIWFNFMVRLRKRPICCGIHHIYSIFLLKDRTNLCHDYDFEWIHRLFFTGMFEFLLHYLSIWSEFHVPYFAASTMTERGN